MLNKLLPKGRERSWQNANLFIEYQTGMGLLLFRRVNLTKQFRELCEYSPLCAGGLYPEVSANGKLLIGDSSSEDYLRLNNEQIPVTKPGTDIRKRELSTKDI